jgi:signal transduction histidine kinase
MRRRAAPSRSTAKKLPRRAAKTRRAAKVARRTTVPNDSLQEQLDQALEREAATAEMLRVISSSPGQLVPIFNAMIESATRLCGAEVGTLALYEDGGFRGVAVHGHSARYADVISKLHRPPPQTALAQLERTRRTIQVTDIAGESGCGRIRRLNPDFRRVRTGLFVPIIKECDLVGAFLIYRHVVRPFTDRQIVLVQNFAAQAVIAIENARLFNELRQRTDDLSEALEQQTATSEVLKVISSSPGELQPVFDAILENATRICDAKFANLLLHEDGGFHRAALYGGPPAWADDRERAPILRPSPTNPISRMVETKQPMHVPDMAAEQAYFDREPVVVSVVEVAKARTVLAVPMLKENELVGAIGIFRQEVRPFTKKQIELVQNFAAQAVIAIENARLLNELRQRTDDLTESLEQQTATSEVLKVISSSPGELKLVFEAILANATHICGAHFGTLYLSEGDAFRAAAFHNAPPAFVEERTRGPIHPNPESTLGRAAQTKQVAQVLDSTKHNPYRQRDPFVTSGADLGGYRTIVSVPMLKEDKLIGIITIYRQVVEAFTDKQIELVQNFAAQAVIAIENTRLLNELRESLQQQTATADVLKIISRSTFDLAAVLDTLVSSAARLCEADSASINRQVGEHLRQVAHCGQSPELIRFMESHPIPAGRGSIVGRTVQEGRIIHVADVLSDPEFTFSAAAKVGGVRTMLGVPLLREGTPIGVIVLQRNLVKPFTAKQIELLTTFADQAVIAIENVRLFDEIQDKSRQLAEASQHKSQFLANMSHELRTPLNAILGYTELIADGVYGTPTEKMLGVLKRLESNGRHLLGLINDVLDLSKIEAGQLVLNLGDYSLKDVTYTVFSAVEPLAADKKLSFKAEVAPDLPKGHGDERRLTQVLLNLVGNAIKFTDTGEVVIKAGASNGSFNLSVHDTGPGISAADQAKLFQEFQQADNSITRKKGGTGLGLAISRRIVELHGGKIWLESAVGRGSTFFVTLPVQARAQAKPN